MYISSGHQKHSMFTCSRHHLSHTDFTTAATLRTNVNTYLVNESTQSGEHVSEGSFWLADFEESQVDVKHLLHQCVVTVAVQQLVLNHTHTHKNRCTKYQCKLYSSISYITVDVWADLWAERCWWRFRRISFCSHRLKAKRDNNDWWQRLIFTVSHQFRDPTIWDPVSVSVLMLASDEAIDKVTVSKKNPQLEHEDTPNKSFYMWACL